MLLKESYWEKFREILGIAEQIFIKAFNCVEWPFIVSVIQRI